MAEGIRFDKATVKWFNENPNADTTVVRCKYCCLYYKPELGHVCNKSPKLEFNRKIGNIELRACPVALCTPLKGVPNTTVDVVMWHKEPDGKSWCFSIAYFVRDDEGYCLKFVGARPFMYLGESRVPELWEALHEAQKALDAWFDKTEDIGE